VKVLITGANGFIGKNLAAHLTVLPRVEVLTYVRESGADDLGVSVRKSDYIVHLAGLNRSDDIAEFDRSNPNLTKALCNAVQESGREVPIIFASSTHAGRGDPYGLSKLAAEEILLQHAATTGSRVYIFRLANVFGKWCRPNYNSVVATFCHNIARDLPIKIDDEERRLNLVFIDDVVRAFKGIIFGDGEAGPFSQVQPIYEIAVGELAEQLRAFRASRTTLLPGRVGAGLMRALYATYLSYLPPEVFVYPLPEHTDARGKFVEVLRTLDSGQVSFFTVDPGVTRGGHYHHTKSEKFLVLRGSARFRFRNIDTQQSSEALTSGDRPEIVETVPGWTHDISNVGRDELIVMIWANEVFDKDRPDTYPSPVQR
jgi:UDP-2-acetamido-2,6-beta-L-arabino-hexul-4-ose reductase